MEEPFDFHRRRQFAVSPARRVRRGGTRTRCRWRVDGGSLRTAILAGVLVGLAAPLGWIGLGTSGGESGVGVGRAAPAAGTERRFGSCFTGGGTNCVVDGDTFWMDGEKVRIADIDTPETHPPRCDEEARLGEAATRRLQVLLNAGPVTLVPIDRDTDRYGRLLRVVERDGRSLGQVVVDEGLARPWEGHRRPWCGKV